MTRWIDRLTKLKVGPVELEVKSKAEYPNIVKTKIPPEPEGTGRKLSNSVNQMMKDLGRRQDVYSYELVEYLLAQHPWYAESSIRPELDKEFLSVGNKKLVTTWIDEVSTLYNADEKLRGRLVILGLAILDENLRRELTKNQFIYDLKDDYKGNKYESMLNKEGKDLWDRYFVEHDTVRTIPDSPARETDVDILGRKTFARALVERMIQIREEEKIDTKKEHEKGAFLIHIHGPWGSGKSSLLNFMRYELEGSKKQISSMPNFLLLKNNPDRQEKKTVDKEMKNKWIVVMFNAWRHQRTGPPWWSLMDAVFKSGVSSLRKISWWRCIFIVLWEYSWRLWKCTSPILWGLTIFFLFLGLGIWSGFFNITSLINPEGFNDGSLNSNIITASLTFIVALLTGLRAISMSLVPGSTRVC